MTSRWRWGRATAPEDEKEWARLRHRMVDDQIAARGLTDERLLRAMRTVPRHRFVPSDARADAYADHALPIAAGQTISQPYIVAFMTALLELRGHERVLEIGTGSGYQAAVLCQLAAEVYSIEVRAELARCAAGLLDELGCSNLEWRVGDGSQGWPEEAPFDGILVTAAPREIPPALPEQLAPGGRLVVPVGDWFQDLVLVRRTDRGFEREAVLPVRFVPLTGGADGR